VHWTHGGRRAFLDKSSRHAPVTQAVRPLRERGNVNNIKLLKAQSNLALTQVDPRLKLGIENYISVLEAVHEASVIFANNLHTSSNPEMAGITLSVAPQELAAFEMAICLTKRAPNVWKAALKKVSSNQKVLRSPRAGNANPSVDAPPRGSYE
jgi:hypothetical protein